MFKQVYGRDYNDNDREDRILIQKSTYLLEWLGLDMGNYCFLWGKHGPYSLDLKGIIRKELSGTCDILRLSTYAEGIVGSIHEILTVGEKIKQKTCGWMELICSIHFIKQFLVKTDRNLMDELKKLKPHFNDDEVNSLAIEAVNNVLR
jgi:hypothetical protein